MPAGEVARAASDGVGACPCACASYGLNMSAASDLARLRWAKTSPADRSAQMRAIAKRPRPNRRKKQVEK